MLDTDESEVRGELGGPGMSFTVREALKLMALDRAVLLAGEAGLDRVITSVNVMEVPEIKRFVKRDEFLVTTTYPIKDDPVAQAQLIADLNARGLAALAIKPVFYLGEVPEVMVQEAQRLAFPLIRLPNDASFNEIINPILAEILNRQAAILRRNEEVHRILTNIVLDGGGPGEIATALSSWVHGPVSIHSATLKLLAYSDERVRPLTGETDTLRKWIADRGGTLSQEGGDGVVRILVHPVTVAGEDYAYVLVWEFPGQPVRFEPTTMEQAGLVVALEISKRRAVTEVERRFQVNVIEDLVQRGEEARDVALARGELFGWDLSGPFTPVLMQIDQTHGLFPLAQDHRELARIARGLRGVAQSVVAARAPGSIVVDMGTRSLILIRPKRHEDRKQARQTVLEVAERIVQEVSADIGVSVFAGVGRTVKDIAHLGGAYRQAGRALEIGTLVNRWGSVVHFDDLGAYRILAEYGDRQELHDFCQDVLSGLLAEPELLRTLEAVLGVNGNLKQAARVLFVHYNTLRYRVGRIQLLTGMDLKLAEDRLSLQLAVKILRMMRDGPTSAPLPVTVEPHGP